MKINANIFNEIREYDELKMSDDLETQVEDLVKFVTCYYQAHTPWSKESEDDADAIFDLLAKGKTEEAHDELVNNDDIYYALESVSDVDGIAFIPRASLLMECLIDWFGSLEKLLRYNQMVYINELDGYAFNHGWGYAYWDELVGGNGDERTQQRFLDFISADKADDVLDEFADQIKQMQKNILVDTTLDQMPFWLLNQLEELSMNLEIVDKHHFDRDFPNLYRALYVRQNVMSTVKSIFLKTEYEFNNDADRLDVLNHILDGIDRTID